MTLCNLEGDQVSWWWWWWWWWWWRWWWWWWWWWRQLTSKSTLKRLENSETVPLMFINGRHRPPPSIPGENLYFVQRCLVGHPQNSWKTKKKKLQTKSNKEMNKNNSLQKPSPPMDELLFFVFCCRFPPFQIPLGGWIATTVVSGCFCRLKKGLGPKRNKKNDLKSTISGMVGFLIWVDTPKIAFD